MAAEKPITVATTVAHVWSGCRAAAGSLSRSRKVGHKRRRIAGEQRIDDVRLGQHLPQHQDHREERELGAAHREAAAPFAPQPLAVLRRGAATVAAPAMASTFDMDFELLPQDVEIGVELRRVAGASGAGRPSPPTQSGSRGWI